jgi:copper(I)-binding protein
MIRQDQLSAGDAELARPGSSMSPRRAAAAQLLRAAAGPVVCAAVLLGLLSAWVASGGAGAISKVRIEVSSAAVAMPAIPGGPAYAYIVLHNLGGADRLESVSAPDGGTAEIVLHHGSAAGAGTVVRSLLIPAHSTVSLTPFGADIVVSGARLNYGTLVPLTLTFRVAGRVVAEATVTAPGTP